eukprot:11969905-Alexandrium_andersonii.AAC.1
MATTSKPAPLPRSGYAWRPGLQVLERDVRAQRYLWCASRHRGGGGLRKNSLRQTLCAVPEPWRGPQLRYHAST